MEENPLERLLKIGTEGPAREVRRGRKNAHPAGWTPGVHLGETGGFVVSEPRESAPDWFALLVELLPPGMEPADFEVEGDSVEIRAWDAGDGEGGLNRLYYFKARVRRRKELADGVNLEDVIEAAKKVRRKKAPEVSDERVYFVQITDLQAGQADGRGVEGMVEKVLELGQIVRDDLANLAKGGRPCSSIFVPITGDLVEGISEWYAMQTFSVELDRRAQTKLVRRLLTQFLGELVETGLPVHVAVVPGNHGENRQGGKAYTTLDDNDDVAVVEQIAEAFALAGVDGLTFSFPAAGRLSLTVEVLGWIVGLSHGHIARGGTGVEGRILNWFVKMAGARDPIGDSDLLFTGHYHHPRFQSLIGDTYWIQGGALCDASDWFSQSAGLVGDPVVMKGTITRKDLVETILPTRWARTRHETEELA